MQKAQSPLKQMIKVILFILCLLAVLAGYLYLHPDVWQKWVKGTPLEPAPTTTNLYKWQDENGQWQVSDTKPASGTEYEILQYKSDTNVMPLVPREDD